jgi:hypothetical protein
MCEEKRQLEESRKRTAIQRGLEHGSEESPLLEDVTRKRLMRTQQAGEKHVP